MSRRVAGIGVLIAVATGACVLAVTVLGLASPAPEGGAVAQSAGQAAVPAPGHPVEADFCFVEAMIPHHEQALQLSALVSDAPGVRDRTRALAEFIEKDQSAEIDTMRRWQDAWAQAQVAPVSSAPASAAHADHGRAAPTADTPPVADPDLAQGCSSHTDHTAMKGMATPEQLAALAELAISDAVAADRMFLELMIVHHDGALEMATIAVHEGANAYVRSSAKHVLIEQAREIAAMTALLAELP